MFVFQHGEHTNNKNNNKKVDTVAGYQVMSAIKK